ncbi:MAG: hypothetical protein HW391_1500 [Chloroflexi bacterium]|nr:hypothetical protein [Chloroflexota bacterium]
MTNPARRSRSSVLRVASAASALLAAGLAMPATVAAHALSKSFESRLPLAVYLVGAAVAVALSFAFVLARNALAAPPADDGRRITVPRPVRTGLRAIGLIGWSWIVVQGIVGGETDAEVSRLFTWVYGWVGVALVSAFIFPLWTWLNPFATLHDVGARALRVAGISGLAPAHFPAALGRWPAVVGFAGVVWLELVAFGAGSRTLALVITGYTVFTLAMMAQFGKRSWTEHGEIFSVWFAVLGRLAPLALVQDGDARDGDDGLLRRRRFGSGLRESGWTAPDVVLIALATASILFDGLSQTQIWVSTFGLPAALPLTLILAGFAGLIAAAAMVVARLVGVPAAAAGLLPISVGYLLAHYGTYLLTAGQRIVIAVSDPLQQGADLFGTVHFEPSDAWLPPAIVWAIQFGAVVGGHMLGAWAGHAVAGADAAHPVRKSPGALRLRQVPFAVLMVALTTITLWSLGQALFISG